MIFKKLEMQGFKSFFNRTEVLFREGINAVVGPNGCGKSNIADAIRWVLGEQSLKMLRGERMEDLIFSGSESRHPLGMAEVCLTMETNGGDAPSPYNELSEICVTRRLYRSGESEFLINNTPCRLRDIRELFLDTGMNPKAYAVIDQGNIGSIISSRPEDRRVLVEEAAGIAKYKERKSAALRKLESTQQNLTRLDDIMREVKRQISALKRQARKAEKYNGLQEEIREVELRTLYQQWCSRQEETESQLERIRGLRELQATLGNEITAAEASIQSGRLILVELEELAQDAREEFYSHRGLLESVEHQLQAKRTRVDQIKSAGTRCEAEAARLSRLLEELSGERSRLREELMAIEARIREQEIQHRSVSDRRSGTAKTAQELKANLEKSTSQFLVDFKREGETQNLVTRAQTLCGSMERDLERLSDENRLLEEEDTRLRSHEQELLENLAGTKEACSGVQEALTTCRTAWAGTEEDLERTEQELHQAREDLSQSSSRLASLTELERSLGGWSERLQKELDRLQQHSEFRDQVRGPVAGCVQVSPEHETALEAVLGEKLKYLLVNSLETAVGAGRCMQKDSSVRGTFLPLSPRARSGNGRPEGPGILGEVQDFVSVSQEYSQVIQHLLHGVILVRDLDVAHTLWTSGDGSWTFVTPTGEVLWPDGSVSAGRIDPSLELLPLLRKIRETKTAAGAAGERVDDLNRIRSELKKRLGELVNEEKRFRETGYRHDSDISSLEKDLSLTRQKSHSLSLQRQRLEEASCKVAAEKEELAEKLTQELARKSEFESGRDQREKDIADREKKLSAVRAEEASLTERANSLQVELAAGKERSSHLRARLERLTSEQIEAESRRDELVQEEAAHRDEGRLETNEVGNLTREREDLSGSREALERRLADAQEEQQQKSGRVREMEEALRRLRLKTEEVQREVAELQVLEAEAHVRLEHLQEKVAEIGRCAPEKLWDRETREAVRQLPPEDLDREHRDLVSRLQVLGPVNLAAIGDHQELQERLNFMTGQREDLEKASEDLHQAIRKINRTSRQRFVETFEKINEQFQQVFPVLFERGQGTLRLTETEDPLEAGIEVLAQPAGKKLQQLSLLSGGEKALASMALLLAIFMVKPTPFCLLDEVDAPLDETNTGRFLTLLDKSINGSQLVVITHNKRTMENASHLIGVTMADPGVSTLISMRLRDQ